MRDAARRSSGPRDQDVADVHPKHVPSDAAEEKAADQRGGVPDRDQVGGETRRGALDHPGRRPGPQREFHPAHVEARIGEGRLEGRADPCPLGGQMRGGLRVEPTGRARAAVVTCPVDVARRRRVRARCRCALGPVGPYSVISRISRIPAILVPAPGVATSVMAPRDR